MGRQIRFFVNEGIEQELLQQMEDLGLEKFDYPSGPFFGFTDPGEDWFNADVIQYSYFHKKYPGDGRLWIGSLNPVLLKVFERVRKYIRRQGEYVPGKGLWVWKLFRDEFDEYREKEEKETDELVQRNKEYAMKYLGWKPKEG